MNHAHKHEWIANHTPGQQRMFFALAVQLNYNAEEVKRKAKLHFDVECFSITQMNWLIDKLLLKRDSMDSEKALSLAKGST